MAATPAEPTAPAGSSGTDAAECDQGALREALAAATLDELHRRNRVAQECRHFGVLVDITTEIARRDGRPSAMARYYHVIGVVYRDELSDPDAAARAFRRALELDPTLAGAQEGLASLSSQ